MRDISAEFDSVIDMLGSGVKLPAGLSAYLEHTAEVLADSGSDGVMRAAGGVFLAEDTGRILFNKRSHLETIPHTFSTWGGGLDGDETPLEGMKRECAEEAGYHGPMKATPLYVHKTSKLEFHNFVIVIPHEFTPHLSPESEDYVWTTMDKLPSPLMPAMKDFLPHLEKFLKQHTTSASLNFGGFGGFDDENPPDHVETDSVKLFRSLKRGDVFKLGKAKWVVVRRADDATCYVYKYPSKGTKIYQIQGMKGEYEVYQVGGSGQRIGAVLDQGSLRHGAVHVGAGLDQNEEILRAALP